MLDVLASRRWTLTWPFQSGPSRERTFADAFARYNGFAKMATTACGTSAPIAAFLALDTGAGGKVTISGLTWVASVVSVFAVNAIPKPKWTSMH